MAVNALREGEDLGLLWQVGNARRKKAERDGETARARAKELLSIDYPHNIYIFVAFFLSTLINAHSDRWADSLQAGSLFLV